MVVASVAVDDVKVLDLLEVMLGSVGGEDGGHTWIETAAEDSAKTSLLETLAVGPLPAVFEMCLVLGFVVGGVHIVHASFEAGIHDGEVLIGEGEVDAEFGLELLHECYELGDIVGIDLCGGDVGHHAILAVALGTNGLGCGVALALSAAGNTDVGKHVGVLGQLVRCYGAYTSAADKQYS